jgi:hypothetical protein
MKRKIEIRVIVASLLGLGLLVLSTALLVSAQTGSDTNKKAKKEPPPLDTAPYEVWTMEQLAKWASWEETTLPIKNVASSGATRGLPRKATIILLTCSFLPVGRAT